MSWLNSLRWASGAYAVLYVQMFTSLVDTPTSVLTSAPTVVRYTSLAFYLLGGIAAVAGSLWAWTR